MATLKLLTSALSLGLGIGIRFSKGIVYKLLVMAGKPFTVWLNDITIYGKGYDFPSQVSNRAPTFLLGANATNPAKIAINAQGRALVSATTARDGQFVCLAEPNIYSAMSTCEHFFNIVSLSGSFATTVSAGAVSAIPVDGKTGVILLSSTTAATTNARASVGHGNADNCIDPQADPILLVCEAAPWTALFSGVNTGRLSIGFLDTDGSSLPTDAAYFRSDDGGAWNCIARRNSLTSSFVTSLTPVLNEWHQFAIRLTASLAEFYIDGAFVGSLNTNLPGGAGRHTGALCITQKTAAHVVSGDLAIDLMRIHIPTTVPLP